VPLEPPAPVSDLDWSPERATSFGNRILELYAGFLESLASGPASPQLTQTAVREAVALEVPEEPLAEDAIAAHLQAILDHSTRPGSGGFFAYISGGGTVPGALVEVIASGLNPNVGGWMLSPAATEIETQLISWLNGRFGMPAGSGGQVVQGGSLANLTALKLARDKAIPDARAGGVRAAEQIAFYATEETHFTVDRAADLLGIGADSVRKIAIDRESRMVVEDLERSISQDLAAGIKPAAIVATAGTTGTGAIDPLPAIAEIAHRHDCWFHVDAAYGGGAVLSDRLRPLLSGIERADSITFDAHKWMYVPLTCAFVLVRDAATAVRSFSGHAAYVDQDKEHADRGRDFGFEGLQLSRNFAALRAWVSLLAHGRTAYARRIEHDVELTNWLARRIEATPELELVCPPSLSICCFRYRPKDVTDEGYMDRLNTHVMTELQIDGTVFPSNASVHGRVAIRTCIVSYRVEATHLEQLLTLTLEIGAEAHASGRFS
jgi:aromatic-L-amino-acid/L-tryptophan decarboxylase